MEELRRELAHRPLVLAALALCVGLTVVLHPLSLLGLPALLLVRRPWPVALAFVLGLTLAPHPVESLRASEWVRGPATVLSVPYEAPEGLLADVAMQGRRFRARFPREALVSRGDVWRLEGSAKPLSEAAEPLALKGIEGKLTPEAFEKVEDGPLAWRLADGWRRGFAHFVRRSLAPDDARWLLGFAIRSADFDEAEREGLVDTGTVHLIAASGLHVAILGTVVMALGGLFGAPRAAILGVTAAIVVLYAMATGLHLPTVRAAVALVVGSSAYMLRREPDGLSALALAVLLYLPFDPAQVYGIGFQLSTTVVGMLVLWPRRDAEPPRTALRFFLAHGRDLVAVSLVAALAAEPILAAREGQISLLTVPTNLLAVPPAMAAVALSLVAHPLKAGWMMPWVGGLVACARSVIVGAGALPGQVGVPPFSPYLLVPFYVAWIGFWRPRARPCR